MTKQGEELRFSLDLAVGTEGGELYEFELILTTPKGSESVSLLDLGTEFDVLAAYATAKKVMAHYNWLLFKELCPELNERLFEGVAELLVQHVKKATIRMESYKETLTKVTVTSTFAFL